MIHVCFGLHDESGRYSKFTGTAMLSIFENTNSKVTVHILHDNTLTQDNRDKFNYLAGSYNQLVKFYNVAELCADKIEEINHLFPQAAKTRFSVAMFYKFFIPHVLPPEIKKAIYLDADIIVNLDIKELWQIELGDKILGVVPEQPMGLSPKWKKVCINGYVNAEDYFNSGVLLMNLQLLREEESLLMEGIRLAGANPQDFYWADQDILNYCFSKKSLKLPPEFNRLTYFRRNTEKKVGNKIYHYATKWGLGVNQSDILNRLWMSYFVRTPWFGIDTIGNFFEGAKKIIETVQHSRVRVSSFVSVKTRGFFIEPNRIEEMKKFLWIRDFEPIIPAENESSLEILIDTMKKNKGKYIFFIMMKNFLGKDFPLERLKAEGLKDFQDYLRAWEFLLESQGLPINSFPLIQIM